MNPIVVTIVIAGATLLLGVFGALQFFASRLEKYIDAKVEGLRAEIQIVNIHVGDVQARLERVERQIDTLFASFKPIPPGRGD